MNKLLQLFNNKCALFLITMVFGSGSIYAQCPDNITVSTSPGQCGATVTYAAPGGGGGGTGGQSANGIVNPSAANGLTGWTIGVSGGSGWATENGYFKTSYSDCSKYQVVTTSGLGLTDEYMDTAPAITISEDYIGWEFNFADTYHLTVELRGASNNVIATYSTGNITTSASLATASHTFTGYGTGVRKIYFSHGGVDSEFWLGNYGAAMTNASVTVTMPGVEGTVEQTAGLASGSFFPVGTTTNTFEITDADDNVTTCSFDITVEDNESPTVTVTEPFTVYLDSEGTASITTDQINNGSTDGCEILSYSLDVTDFDCDDLGDNTVTLTVTDIHGNTGTGNVVITVDETTLPIAVAQNITVQLDADGLAEITAEQINNNSSDNCTVASYEINVDAFTCDNIGDNTIALTVTDAAGNIAVATAVVTVEETLEPTVLTQNITISLNEDQQVSITAEDLDNGSTDNCSIASVSIDNSTFTCDNLGENTVTLTVTDSNGNSGSAVATVTVDDPGNYCEAAGLNTNRLSTITIYPNPTKGQLVIDAGDILIEKIQLYDVSGRLIQTTAGVNALDISQFNAGIYFLKLYGNNTSIMKQIVKQ
jgi:hypothetical protein